MLNISFTSSWSWFGRGKLTESHWLNPSSVVSVFSVGLAPPVVESVAAGVDDEDDDDDDEDAGAGEGAGETQKPETQQRGGRRRKKRRIPPCPRGSRASPMKEGERA